MAPAAMPIRKMTGVLILAKATSSPPRKAPASERPYQLRIHLPQGILRNMASYLSRLARAATRGDAVTIMGIILAWTVFPQTVYRHHFVTAIYRFGIKWSLALTEAK